MKHRLLVLSTVTLALAALLFPAVASAAESATQPAGGAAELLAAPPAPPPAAPAISPADTAWMLISTALVLLMTPALAFFYGGLVRGKNMLNTMMMSFVALGVVTILWALLGYSLSFDAGNRFIGGAGLALLKGVGKEPAVIAGVATTIPAILFMAYQATFAVITPALISGAIVDRMRFGAYVLFIALWSLVVYTPVAHWVWGGGFLGLGEGNVGALDFAGGTVVHINAGVAALMAALVLGRRKDFGKVAMLPHNVPFVLLGAGLLWFGWFGFNAGSAGGAGEVAAFAFANTFLAPAATLTVWALLDLTRTGKITGVGAATAIVVGLVAITPAAGYVAPIWGLTIGALAAFPSYFAILFRAKTRLDDSLDVVAAHGLGGVTGALLTGVFAQKAINPLGADGLIAGNPGQVVSQAIAIGITIAFSGVLTFVLLKLVNIVVPLRISAKDEAHGADITQHGEEAYATSEGAVLLDPEESKPTLAAAGRAAGALL